MAEELNNKIIELKEKPDLGADFPPVSYEEWRKKVEADLKGADFEKKLVTKTYEGINLQPVYTRKDLEGLPTVNGLPGFGGYVRGSKAAGYLPGGWDIVQELPFGDAEEFNEALKNDLRKGQNAVSVKFDGPTKAGLDADYSEAGKVGKEGLSVSGPESLRRAFRDIDLTAQPLYVEAGFSSLPVLSLLKGYFTKEKIDIKNIKGSIEADPLGYIVKNGELPYTPEDAFAEMKTSVEWLAGNAQEIKSIGVSGENYNNAGASAVQELAFSLATAVEYITRLTELGLDADTVVSKMRFTYGIGPFFFMEVAKLRAARVLWAKILEAYGVKEEGRKMYIHGKTTFHNQTKYDPYVNMLRTTTEAFSGVIGGLDSLTTNPFDEVYGLPSQFSRRIARNTQIILNEEAHLAQLIDPAGGSFYVEKLTDEVINKAWELFLEIEERGGMLKAIESSFVKEEIAKVNAERDKAFSKRKAVQVGTNMYANTKEVQLGKRLPDYNKLYVKRSEYVRKYRTSGPTDKHESILSKLQKIAENKTGEIVDVAAEAIAEGATLGEITKVLRAGKTETYRTEPLEYKRAASLFEELRDASAAYREKTGNQPQVFLLNMGSLKQFKARADFSTGFFEAGGFEVITNKGFEDTGSAAEAFAESGAKVAVICSTDDTYPEIVPPLVKQVKENDPEATVILAGYPKDQVEEHKKAGVDNFIYLGADVYSILSDLLKKRGVL